MRKNLFKKYKDKHFRESYKAKEEMDFHNKQYKVANRLEENMAWVNSFSDKDLRLSFNRIDLEKHLGISRQFLSLYFIATYDGNSENEWTEKGYRHPSLERETSGLAEAIPMTQRRMLLDVDHFPIWLEAVTDQFKGKDELPSYVNCKFVAEGEKPFGKYIYNDNVRSSKRFEALHD